MLFTIAQAVLYSAKSKVILHKENVKNLDCVHLLFHTVLSALRLLCAPVALWVLPLYVTHFVSALNQHVMLITFYVKCIMFTVISALHASSNNPLISYNSFIKLVIFESFSAKFLKTFIFQVTEFLLFKFFVGFFFFCFSL